MPLPEGPHAWDSEAYAPGPSFRFSDVHPPEVPDPLHKCIKPNTLVHTQPVSVPCPGHPVVLSLDAVLPVTRADPNQPWQDDMSALAWNAASNWIQHVTDSLDLQLSPVPAQIACTPSTWNAIFEALEAPIGPYELIEAFVDGATSAVAASWSLVLVAHHGGSQRLLGTLAGPVITGTAHQQWLGAATLDNIAAELSALAAALATVLQYQFNCPVLIRPDLSLSRLIAQELVTTVSNPRLAQLCRLLAVWAPPNVRKSEGTPNMHGMILPIHLPNMPSWPLTNSRPSISEPFTCWPVSSTTLSGLGCKVCPHPCATASPMQSKTQCGNLSPPNVRSNSQCLQVYRNAIQLNSNAAWPQSMSWPWIAQTARPK